MKALFLSVSEKKPVSQYGWHQVRWSRGRCHTHEVERFLVPGKALMESVVIEEGLLRSLQGMAPDPRLPEEHLPSRVLEC